MDSTLVLPPATRIFVTTQPFSPSKDFFPNNLIASRLMAARNIPLHRVDFSNEHPSAEFDESRLRQAVERVLADAGIPAATISVAIVDDPTIHDINRRFLEHDEPTDVISFVLEQTERHLEGEIVASYDTAATVAKRLGWSTADELLLYIVHGALHLVGYDDLDPDSKREMRRREREVLTTLGVEARYDEEEGERG